MTNYKHMEISISDLIDENKFTIPRYQRSLVWPMENKRKLIKTIQNGDPIGTVLVRQKNGKYELIDGLQRVSTIKNYITDKYQFLDYEDIDFDFSSKLWETHCKEKGIDFNAKKAKPQIEAIQQDFLSMIKANKKIHQIMTSLRKKYDFNDNDDINNLIENIIVDFNSKTDISALIIYAIDYTGPEVNIPNVFYHMNTGAKPLSKYDTLAALWSFDDYVKEITDESIKKKVRTKYQKASKDSELELEFDINDIDKGINLYEYCYAIGELLKDELKNVFGDGVEKQKDMGFDIIAMIAGEQYNNAELISNYLKDASPDFLIKLKDTIVDVAEVISQSLSKVTKSITGNQINAESTYLIYHMFISYFKQYYRIDFKTKVIEDNKTTLLKEDFRKYLGYHYVFDSITDFWERNRQASDLKNACESKELCEKYWYEIGYDKWQNACDYFFESQNDANKKNPSFRNKLFLDFYTRIKIDVNNEYNKYFKKTYLGETEDILTDIEHITTKKSITTHINDLSKPEQNAFPYSHIGNLCYLAARDNRGKRDITIYEYKDGRPSFALNREYLDFIKYPEENDLKFMNLDNMNFRKNYKEFYTERAKNIKNDFLVLIKNHKIQ